MLLPGVRGIRDFLSTVVVFLTVLCGILSAQQKVDPQGLLSKSARAVRVNSPPVIDGRLEDAAWEDVLPVTDLIQTEPDNLALPTESTEVRIVYDDSGLYFAFRCYDSEPAGIMRRMARRDQWMEAGNDNSDWINVALDPQDDNRTGYVFIVNAAGVKMDLFIPDDENYDSSWDAVWDAKVSVDDEGWIAELELPFSVFQFDSKGEQTWGMELNRVIYRKQEWHEWPGKPRGVKGIVSRFGALTGLADIPPPRQIEILPYVLGGLRMGDVTNSARGAGMDMEYGISTNAAASFTINPDFGQVEADPSVLNLTAFETFYPEKRPFFVEGGSFFTPQYGEEIETWMDGAFMLPPIKLFHSRRIGRAPSYLSPSSGTLMSQPDATTILGAAKVLGKTPSGVTYGFIESVTDEEYGVLESVEGDRRFREDFLLEPRANYFIGRIEAPVINSSSILGATVTDVRREAASGATVAAMDWRFRFMDNRLDFSGQAAMSQVAETRAAASRLSLVYDNFKWWSGDLIATYYGDGFDSNDLGFLERSGVWAVRAGGGLRKQDPWGPFRSNHFNLRYFHYARTDGIALARRIEANLINMFKSFWMVGIGGQALLRATDDGDLFKDPNGWMVGTSPAWLFFLFASTDPRKRLVLSPVLAGGKSETGGYGIVPMLNMTVNPTDFLRISLETMYWEDREMEQYVAVLPEEGASPDGGVTGYSRVYGTFDQTLTDIKLRISWTVSPDLSFQLFGQPFTATGDYHGFKELTKQSTLDFSPISSMPYDPDFRIRNLVGTFVMRWEYLLGSTLFIVYNFNDSRYYSAAAGQWFPTDSNTLFIKLNYWFSG